MSLCHGLLWFEFICKQWLCFETICIIKIHLFEPNNLFKSSYILFSNNTESIWLLSLVLNINHWRTEDEPDAFSETFTVSVKRERRLLETILSSFRESVCAVDVSAALRSCWNVSGMLQCTLGKGCFQLQPWVTNGNQAMTEETPGFVNEAPRCSADWFLSSSTGTHYTWPYIRAAALQSQITPEQTCALL